MDTTTVNFAINKLSEGWQKVAPTVMDVGDKYVQYVVMKELIGACISLGVFLILSVLAIIVLKKAYKTRDSDIYGPVTMAVTACVLLSFVTLLTYTYSAALAYSNPEMFTIQELIEAAK